MRESLSRDTPLVVAAREALVTAEAEVELARAAEIADARTAARGAVEAVIAPVTWRDSGLAWVHDDPLICSDGAVSLAVQGDTVTLVELVDGQWTSRRAVETLVDVGRWVVRS